MTATGGVGCSSCVLKYHRACLAIPERAPIGKEWSCPNCKKNVRKGDNNHTPVKGLYDEPVAAAGAAPSSSPKEGTLSDAPAGRGDGELIIFMAEMREFRKEMTQLLGALRSRMDTVERRLDALEQAGPGVAVPGGTADLERTIVELKQELNDRDQEALLSDLEIGQLPEESGTSVAQSVTVMAARLGVQLEERDIVFAERVGPPAKEAGGRPRRVVVRLARRGLRDELLRAARVRRTLTAADGARVYVNERLTRFNRQLFHRVREECRRLRWRYSWTRRGRIYVRQADGSPVFQLRSDADVERVLGSSP